MICGSSLEGVDGDSCESCREQATQAGVTLAANEPTDPLIGTTVGAYRVLAAAGEGGMGRVYKARHERLGRVVALKVLPPGSIDDPDLRQRFVREARSASQLAHPNIVTVHDLVREDDRDFLVMEFVDGPTLAEEMPPGGLPLDRALRYARQVGGALAAAHRAGIVHRDLKPGNVMIAEGDRAKLMDFGLAKLTHSGGEHEAATATALTRLGAVVGTVDYMSPEQVEGGAVDQRSDIFSFGAMLYEMLTGRRPFAGTSLVQVMNKVANQQPRPVSALRPEVGPELVALVRRAMAKRPEERFATVEEMLAGLGDEDSGTVSAAGLPLALRRLRAAGRRRWRAALLAGVLLALAAALAIPATRELLRAGVASALSTLVPERAENLDALGPPELYRTGREMLRNYRHRPSIEAALDRFQRGIAKDPGHAASYAGLALAKWHLYRLDREPLFLDQALFSAEKAVDLDGQLSAARVALAQVLIDSGDLDRAEQELEAVRRLDPANAEVFHGLGTLARKRSRLGEATEHFQQAIALDPTNSELAVLLGRVLYHQGRYPEAEAQYRRVIELDPDSVLGYQTLAAALHMQGRYPEAATALQQALEIEPSKPLYTNLGTLYFFQGLYANAVTAFERAIELGANKARDWANLGDGYRWTPGNEEKARQAYQRSQQLLEKRLKADPEDLILRSRLAVLLAKQGEAAAAVELATTLAAEDRLDTTGRYRLALAYEIAGDRTRALAALERALDSGYSLSEVESDPELSELRSDPGYHLLVGSMEGE